MKDGKWTVQITQEDAETAEPYCDGESCLLATAIKRELDLGGRDYLKVGYARVTINAKTWWMSERDAQKILRAYHINDKTGKSEGVNTLDFKPFTVELMTFSVALSSPYRVPLK